MPMGRRSHQAARLSSRWATRMRALPSQQVRLSSRISSGGGLSKLSSCPLDEASLHFQCQSVQQGS